MADEKRPSLTERVSALPGEPKAVGYKPAVPPTCPGRIGFGKLLVPPRPELRSAPAHEETKHGVAPPAPESAPMPAPASPPPPKRSRSPVPAELAPTPESVREARAEAKAAVAAQDAAEAEQRRALKPSVFSQLLGWIGTPRGKAALALAGTLAAGGGWSQAREAILATLGIESSAAAQAREDRLAKLIADTETKATDQRIKAGEIEQRLDTLKTTTFTQANEIADLNLRVPKIKAQPSE